MQFQVPQFIEIEDKIFARLTLKQFLYLVGGLGASVAIYIYIPVPIVSVVLIIPVVVFSLALAFYKVNNRPFIDIVQSFFYYYIAGKLYLWKKEEKKPISQSEKQKQAVQPLITVPKISASKLKDLSWSLNIKENLNPINREENQG